MQRATVRQLQIFVEAAQTLSFARVADRLHLSPAAVSFQIKQVEEQAGCPLFERLGKTTMLTDAGRTLLVYARQILQALADAERAMTALKGEGGHVTLGVVTTAAYFVPHVLARFRVLHPQVEIRLVDGNRREILALLSAGRADLVVMGQPPDEADLVAEPFADHPSVSGAAPSHARAPRRRVTLADLAHEAVILREEGSGTRALFDRHFRNLRPAPKVGMVSSSNETIKQAVMAGMGIALLSAHTIGQELGQGKIIVLPVAGFPLMRSWYVSYRPTFRLLPAHCRLRDFLIEHGGAVLAAMDGFTAGPAATWVARSGRKLGSGDRNLSPSRAWAG